MHFGCSCTAAVGKSEDVIALNVSWVESTERFLIQIIIDCAMAMAHLLGVKYYGNTTLDDSKDDVIHQC